VIKKLRTVLFLPLVMLQSCGDTEINHQGSDALLEVTTSLAQAYRDAHAGIAISVSGGGSGGGIASLIRGELDIANSNRPLNEKELEAAKKSDVKPIAHIVGYAGIAIFVHKDNPIKSLTIAQLKALFGDGGTANGWSDLGIRVGTSDADDSVILVSREDSTGAHEYFLDLVLGNDGSFKTRCVNQTSAENVVTMCAQSKNAIGYSGLGYATEDVSFRSSAKVASRPFCRRLRRCSTRATRSQARSTCTQTVSRPATSRSTSTGSREPTARRSCLTRATCLASQSNGASRGGSLGSRTRATLPSDFRAVTALSG
jgi:ABC-type phosphate transport system substrate-binding protein